MRSTIFFLFSKSILITGCFNNNESKTDSKAESKTDPIIEKTYTFSNDLKNDLKKLNLFGKVISVKEYSYSAELINGGIAKGNREREYLNTYDNFTIFNESGYILEKYNYKSDSTIYDTQTFKYDNRNNLIEENYHNNYENTKIKFIYGYNVKGQLFSKKTYNENNILTSTLKYEYENNNKIVNCLSYDENGNYVSTNISHYDENGNEVETCSSPLNRWTGLVIKNTNFTT